MKASQDFTKHHLNVAIELLKMPDLPLACREHNVEAALAHLRVVQQNLNESENYENATD